MCLYAIRNLTHISGRHGPFRRRGHGRRLIPFLDCITKLLAYALSTAGRLPLTKNLQFVASVIAFAHAQNPLPLLAVSLTTVRCTAGSPHLQRTIGPVGAAAFAETLSWTGADPKLGPPLGLTEIIAMGPES